MSDVCCVNEAIWPSFPPPLWNESKSIIKLVPGGFSGCLLLPGRTVRKKIPLDFQKRWGEKERRPKVFDQLLQGSTEEGEGWQCYSRQSIGPNGNNKFCPLVCVCVREKEAFTRKSASASSVIMGRMLDYIAKVPYWGGCVLLFFTRQP